MVLAQDGPKIEFKDKDNTIDYGKVTKEEDSGLRVFEFTNTGNQPLGSSLFISSSSIDLTGKK